MMQSASWPTLSLSCIETLSHDKAAVALQRTLKTLEACGGHVLKRLYWFSNAPCPIAADLALRRGADFVQWVRIESFRLDRSFNDQLNELTLDLVPKTVDTDFNLVVQADGYAVNAEAWTDLFFEYDYIGASWPNESAERAVGNGGFSMRSKKLYQAILDLRRRYSLEDLTQRLTQNDICEDKFVGHSIPEDNLICKIYRPTLEQQYGIRFAPAELADRFSIETNAGSPWFGASFGFHGHFAGSFYIKAR
jgi:hypothetical protein